MKNSLKQLAAFLTLFQFFVSVELSLFAQERMPDAKDHLKKDEVHALATATLPLIQTLPGLPPSGRNGSFLGEEVANLGDVNGDGYEDWALGLKDAAIYPSGEKVGKVYVYLGSNVLINEKDPTLILTGEADGDLFGLSVSGAGDVNHDGFSDVLVGAYANSAAGFEAGRAYLFWGGPSMDNHADVIFTGEASTNYFGYSVAAAGDVNHDGFSDVIVGACANRAGGILAGRVYIYFGGASMNNRADVILESESAYSYFGYSVAAAGDVNHDGFADVIVGTNWTATGGSEAGRAYLYLGGASMDNIPDVIFTGEESWDYFGSSVAAAGDVNRDGFADVIIGAIKNDAAGLDAGRAYLYLGGTNMDNRADVIFSGEGGSDYFGNSVATAGDVNHDGFSDVIVGAYWNDAGFVDEGEAYIYFGGANMDNIADVILTGEASSNLFGISVSSAGDVNRDGFSDVIVGALWNDAGGLDAGRAYIYFGRVGMDNRADVIFSGEASGDRYGISVASAGDVNHDGFSDVIVGAYLDDAGGIDAGRAYLHFGGSSMSNIPDLIFTGEGSGDQFGVSVTTAGDVNHDGFSDVIVGANSNSSGGYLAGRAYIYFGGAKMDNIADVILTGEAGVDHFGASVSAAGDVNHDGFSDVIVGANSNSAGGLLAGRAYLYFGGASMNNIADVIFTGEADGDNFGNSVSAAGDVNHDGFSDVMIGAYLNGAAGYNAGRAYLYFGGASMDNIADVVFAGGSANAYLGRSVATAGDVNQDGFSDVLVGGLWYDATRFDGGRAYLYFGGLRMDNVADVIFSGELSIDLSGSDVCVAAAGDVNHDGFSDVVIGTDRTDVDAYDAGRAYLYFGGANMDNIADVIFRGEASSDLLGVSVAAAGDVNQDGFADVIIGAAGSSAVGYQMGRAYVFAGSAAGTGVEDQMDESPGRYHLFQNFPNPCNPTTTIRFSLPQREHVTLRIFDLLGKEVATLVEDDFEPGEHSVVFDGNGLSSGVYLYHVKAGSFVEQKELVLLK